MLARSRLRRRPNLPAKRLLIIGGIILVCGILAFGAVLYAVHLAKNKISSLTGGTRRPGQVQVSRGNACSLLSRDELQQVLGVAVEKSSEIMEGNEPGCAYYTNPEAFKELQRIAVEQAKGFRKSLQGPRAQQFKE